MKLLKIHERDNVAVMLEGELQGHKTALRDIAAGENVIKYGYPIGHALGDIHKGEHVHTHNLGTNLSGTLEYVWRPSHPRLPELPEPTFPGYVRENGSVGIRNEIWIVTTVGCVNKAAEAVCREANRRFAGKCDGVFSFPHPFGCSQLGGDQLMTQKILKGLVNHPNAAGVLVLGLGCENNNIPAFREILGETDSRRVKFLNAQDWEDEVEEGLALIGELADYAGTFTRRECGLSALRVGLKCGGSDGFSGLTANPLIGRVSDRLIASGGSTVLTEVPEMFGAETILMDRCEDGETFQKTVSLINGFKEYFARHGQPVYENPSPGNKEGGITTLEDKSLGCVQKSGSAPVSDVIGAGDPVKRRGLTLLSGPGNDMVSVTNLTASGCQLILFSTGRGTPLGAPVPTVKISSNSALAQKKPGWIDFDAGPLLEGKDLTGSLFDLILRVAGGEATKNELHGFREISIFKDGVVL